MKKLTCFAAVLALGLMAAVPALAYEDKGISYSKCSPFFEHDRATSTYTSVHSWTVANVKHTFRVYSTANNSTFTGAQTRGTTVSKNSNAESCSLLSGPNFAANITNNGESITVLYRGGSYRVNYYADFYYDEAGNRIPIKDTLHNMICTPNTGHPVLGVHITPKR